MTGRASPMAAALRGLAGAALVACIGSYASAQGWDTKVVPPTPAKPAVKAKPAAVPASVLHTGSVPPQAAERKPEPADASPAQKYCVNIADAAADARFAWQKKSLADI